jgi:hypothetical protein
LIGGWPPKASSGKKAKILLARRPGGMTQAVVYWPSKHMALREIEISSVLPTRKKRSKS